MQKSFAILVALIGTLAAVASANDLELIGHRLQLAHHSVESRALKSGKLARRGQSLNGGAGLAALAMGFANGLQFSPGLESQCYSAMSTSILATDQLVETLKKIYDPRKMPEALLINKDNIDAIAAITAYCNVDKLVNTITQSLGEGASTAVARIAGGLINEIPNQFNNYINADSNILIYIANFKIQMMKIKVKPLENSFKSSVTGPFEKLNVLEGWEYNHPIK